MVKPAGARILKVSIQPKPKKTIVSIIATQSMNKPARKYSKPSFYVVPLHNESQALNDKSIFQRNKGPLK